MHPNDVDGIANGADPDQTAPIGGLIGSALFAQTYLSENLGSIRYIVYMYHIYSDKCSRGLAIYES